MQRFTISLDDELARRFDQTLADQGYGTRSEAVRDLIRARIDQQALDDASAWCAASLSYVYDHHDRTVTARVLDLQHAHHDLVAASMHLHLDHDHCLETVLLRGRHAAVQAFAQQLLALRGVRHGALHRVPLTDAGVAHHHEGDAQQPAHRHLRPLA
jgi:CopG family nickel-responsive transcriptional regulator